MSLEALRAALPEYARDIRLNLGSLATEPVLTEEQRAGAFIASAVSSAVPSTLDEMFVSYRTCVLEERHAAEADLTSSLHAARKSAEMDFQAAIATTTSNSIDTLNATLRSAAAEFAVKRDSVVNAITHA